MDDEIQSLVIKCGDLVISSFYPYISDVTRNSISFEACNGVESGISLIVQGSSVDVEIDGDWGRITYRKVLSEEGMNALKNQLLEIINNRERNLNGDGEDIKTPDVL
jgi:hypothetical protein